MTEDEIVLCVRAGEQTSTAECFFGPEVRRLRAENAALKLTTSVEDAALDAALADVVVSKDVSGSVEAALRRASMAHAAGWTRADQAEMVLAAEVLRLRDEHVMKDEVVSMCEARESIAMQRETAAEAKLARIARVMPEIFHGCEKELVEAGMTFGADEACVLLDAALRGEP